MFLIEVVQIEVHFVIMACLPTLSATGLFPKKDMDIKLESRKNQEAIQKAANLDDGKKRNSIYYFEKTLSLIWS